MIILYKHCCLSAINIKISNTDGFWYLDFKSHWNSHKEKTATYGRWITSPGPQRDISAQHMSNIIKGVTEWIDVPKKVYVISDGVWPSSPLFE